MKQGMTQEQAIAKLRDALEALLVNPEGRGEKHDACNILLDTRPAEDHDYPISISYEDSEGVHTFSRHKPMTAEELPLHNPSGKPSPIPPRLSPAPGEFHHLETGCKA
jgi:hypothetical protein